MPRPAKSNLLGQNTIINLEATRPRHLRRESRIRHVLVAPLLPSVPRTSDSSSKPALLELVIIPKRRRRRWCRSRCRDWPRVPAERRRGHTANPTLSLHDLRGSVSRFAASTAFVEI